ncbi:MAG TPA: T9SS type A sorting domain-containing protein [Melioribacteraceae bacterium]|nr:T9SS type A sorting domain-containing protein [Melioribacteraceae bacterium]
MKKSFLFILTFLFISVIFAKSNDDPPHLPVELIYFKADVYYNIVLLSWGTATELNNYGFVIERSTTEDFVNFENLGFVEGHGTSYNTWHYSFEDTTISVAGTYFYRLNQIDIDGNNKYSPTVSVVITNIEDEINVNNLNFNLEQNFPNPFNPATTIRFSLKNSNKVLLIVYDNLGKIVKTLIDKELSSGDYSIIFNAENLTSGIYFYSLKAGNKTITKKMIYQK